MILKWLTETFPADLRLGWALVRRDLLLWLAILTLTSLAMAAVPPLGAVAPSDFLVLLILVTALLAPLMLAPMLFAAEAYGRRLSTGRLLQHMLRRVPINLACIFASFVAFRLLFEIAGDAVRLTLHGSVIAEVSAATVELIINVTLLTRFGFLPFVINLYRRDELPRELWEWKRAEPLGPALWPFTVSSRLVDGLMWRLAPYVLLNLTLQFLARHTGAFVVPAHVAAQFVQVVLSAILFRYFVDRLRERGAAPPRLPE